MLPYLSSIYSKSLPKLPTMFMNSNAIIRSWESNRPGLTEKTLVLIQPSQRNFSYCNNLTVITRRLLASLQTRVRETHDYSVTPSISWQTYHYDWLAISDCIALELLQNLLKEAMCNRSQFDHIKHILVNVMVIKTSRYSIKYINIF